MKTLCSVILTLCVCSPLRAQTLGFGYEIARANQVDMREAGGLGLRLRFRIPIELRYDYLTAHGQRFDSPCGFNPSCGPETINYSSDFHSLFLAVRARLLSRGSFDLFALPEVGVTSGSFAKRSATGTQGASGSGSNLGAGGALELSVARLGGTAIGSWVAVRSRRFVSTGAYLMEAYHPHRELAWVRSVEVGVTFALQPR